MGRYVGDRGPNIGIKMPMIRRMNALRDAGLSAAATAIVMNLDNDSCRFTEHIVRYYTRRAGRPFARLGVAGLTLTHTTGNLPRPSR